MSAKEIGQDLVKLCREGKNLECIEKYYAQDVESVEAMAPPGGDRVTKGIEGVKGKNQWWMENHEVHSASVEGPYPHGKDRFAVRFDFDVTFKPEKKRTKMDEIAVFHVKDGKIVREEFFYDM
ncbi:MAG: nuclear transport factor 2 family protein [Sandaracinaceae bacterium]|nr:MAG: nuclear transport factor 2 family protein [Sandaracinaceae bacterium]